MLQMPPHIKEMPIPPNQSLVFIYLKEKLNFKIILKIISQKACMVIHPNTLLTKDWAINQLLVFVPLLVSWVSCINLEV